MKHAIIALLLLLAPLPAAAQHLKLHLGGGLASQWRDAGPVGAFKIGLGYEHEFDQHWTIAPALLFSAKGWKDPDRPVPVLGDDGLPMTDEDGQPLQSLMGRSTSANYLELPVLLNYYHRVGSSRYLVFAAGPYAAIGLSGKIKTRGDATDEGSRRLFYEDNTFGTGGVRRFDAGLQTLAGYQFATGLTIGLEADFSLSRVSRGGGRSIAGLASLSYKF